MRINDLQRNIEQAHKTLETHPIFNTIQDIDDLRCFMSWHVFAVWDFMCLVKRLQRELTTIEQPWLPPAHPQAARLINEIVLGEESDELPDGSFISHFELYLLAMQEVGANTDQIRNFINALHAGEAVDEALVSTEASQPIRHFVDRTLDTVTNGNIYQVLGSFFYGREHIIPQMFEGLLREWHIDQNEAPMFVYYLKRHIELDGDSHGPAAMGIIKHVTKDKPNALRQLYLAALDAMNDRIELWDGLNHAISHDQPAISSNRA